jgi:putative ABC transport system permease protein
MISIFKHSLISSKHISILKVAFKMLINSKKKFIGMLIGATFAAFIIMQQPSIYQGVSDRLVAQINSIKEADLWVMDQNSLEFNQPTQFNSMDIYRIRSIPGVIRAVQLHKMWYPMKHLKTEQRMDWELIGVDPKTLIGLPEQMISGVRSSILSPNAIIIDGYSLKQFETAGKKTINIGDQMIEGRNTWKVTGITKPLRTYKYEPKAYMLSNHIPAMGYRPSFILVKVAPSFDIRQIASQIRSKTNYKALTTAEFSSVSLKFFREKTPIIIIFIVVAIMGFVIGLIIMWQIFGNFILTHLHQFGMLKMLGVSNNLLTRMVLFQAAFTGGIGYMIGLFLTGLFEIIVYDSQIAFHLTWQIAGIGALGIMLIIVISSYFSILKVLRLDTVDLCRDLN